MAELKITDVQCFHTMPTGTPAARLIVVKVLTSEPGLYGLGCATYAQRHRAVEATLTHHLGPLVVGRDPRDIEELWRLMMVNGYWRNGPVINNAVSGIDMALWDILGKLANMPCYQLWGGKMRPAAAVYVHADGKEPEAVIDRAREFIEQGFHYVRLQLAGYQGLDGVARVKPAGAPEGAYFDPTEKMRRIPKLFEKARAELGDRVELLHDVHERLEPIRAVALAKALEPYNLFFLEDALSPEQGQWFAEIRRQSATPLAMGELFVNAAEIQPLVENRWIDFVRCHISAIGGITPAIKLAHMCEAFGVRTAWHGPGDVSGVGVAANIHLDVAMHNFGVQEWAFRNDAERAIFPGMPELRDGYAWCNDKPGLGVDFNEDEAANYPPTEENPLWTVARRPDGGLWTP
jgi:mannonate dehydratase